MSNIELHLYKESVPNKCIQCRAKWHRIVVGPDHLIIENIWPKDPVSNQLVKIH